MPARCLTPSKEAPLPPPAKRTFAGSLRLCSLLFLPLALFPAPLAAQTEVRFNNGSGNQTWETSTNWNTGSVPTSDLTTHFAYFSTTATGTHTIAGNTTVSGIRIQSGSHTFSASAGSPTLTLGTYALVGIAGDATFNVDLVFDGSSGSPTVNAIGGPLNYVFNGSVSFINNYIPTGGSNPGYAYVPTGSTYTFNGGIGAGLGTNDMRWRSNGGDIYFNGDSSGQITAGSIVLWDNNNVGSRWFLGASNALDDNLIESRAGASMRLFATTGGTTQSNNIKINSIGSSSIFILGGTNTSGTATFSGDVSIATPTNTTASLDFTWHAAAGGTVTFSGNTSYANTYSNAVTDTFRKTGGGTVILSGTFNLNNGHAGSTTQLNISEGTLLLGASDRLSDNVNLILSGGTFSTGGYNETLGSLTLTADSAIDMGQGGILSFASLSDASIGTYTLSIYNWNGTAGTGGGANQIRFASHGSFSRYSQIQFYEGGVGSNLIGNAYGFVTNNELVPEGEAIIPEPSTVLSAGALLLLLGLSEYRRRQRAAASPAAC